MTSLIVDLIKTSFYHENKMKILLSGSGGLIGKALIESLMADGHEISRLVRKGSRPASSGDIIWEPENPDFKLNPALLEPFDSIVNLAGEPIFSLRWTERKKERIRQSRVIGTRILAEALSKLDGFQGSFICASAIGFYGNRGSEILTEPSSSGNNFLASIAKEWEAASNPAADAGVRTVNARIGIVLSRQGGTLQAMLPVFRIGLGGRLGNGKQYMSWIDIDDLVSIFKLLIEDDSISGPVNLVSPNPVTNYEFTVALANSIGIMAAIPLPSFLLKLLFGQMADELLLASTRVLPDKITTHGYLFEYPDLQKSLDHQLNKTPAEVENNENV